MVINGETINDFGISFGIGLPIGGFSNANIGFDLGKEEQQIQDLFRRITSM